jgi:ribosomal-protein-alanine N-acetyltransferase
MTAIRPGEAADLGAVAAIQSASHEAVRWNVADYLDCDFRVAVSGEQVVGFLVARTVGEGERELLNLAVASECRHQGVGRMLLENFLRDAGGAVFLEVRESNSAARNIYKSIGFREVGTRQKYYHDPLEAAIVMKFHSC